ncbi:VOC family protein [Shewanella cyperi]|uniref:VOC family protein n=1 Tax=Shewanella cyperi TaxID=2814292 RepID=UPI001A9401B3|nr:VOC family protein [Shewanella cyperi]QSX42187.1 VOC family protein [Shewanella cyperi]
MSLTLAQLQRDWQPFADDIQALAQSLDLMDTAQGWHCDHVALRVNSTTAAEALVQEFEAIGTVISNNLINGRPILIIALDEPLQLGPWSIDCVELPFPGEKHYPKEGWEHIELVFPCKAADCDALEAALGQALPTVAERIKAPGTLRIKASSPQGEHERLANPTLAFSDDKVCIKLHPHGIRDIIASENASVVADEKAAP